LYAFPLREGELRTHVIRDWRHYEKVYEERILLADEMMGIV
jgi:hypothetical protein